MPLPFVQFPIFGASAILAGNYTVATLPDPATSQGKYAFVTDLGGGPDYSVCDGTSWKHIRNGVIIDVPIATTVNVTPLKSPPYMRMTGAAFASASAIRIKSDNLYPGYTMRIVVPANVLGALGTIGVNMEGGFTIPLLGGTWSDIMWNGSDLVTTAKGTL